jgi:transcriptional regulator with XRE-family HTH domain
MSKGPYKNKLKKYREAKLTPQPMTQQALAERLKKRGFRVTASYISQIESGFKHIPYGLAIAICEELGLEPSQAPEVFLPSSFTGSENSYKEQAATLDATGTEGK